MNSLLSWLGLLTIGLIIVIQIFSFASAKQAFKMLEGNAGDESLLSEARKIDKQGARARMKWLKMRQAELAGDTLRTATRALKTDFACRILLLVLVALWIAAIISK